MSHIPIRCEEKLVTITDAGKLFSKPKSLVRIHVHSQHVSAPISTTWNASAHTRTQCRQSFGHISKFPGSFCSQGCKHNPPSLPPSPNSRKRSYLQALALHPNFIAVGFSRGGVLIAPGKPSKDGAHQSQSKAFVLGGGGQIACSALDMHLSGELLLAGYSDGTLVLWDVQRSVAAR